MTTYIKELAMHISRLGLDWGRAAFIHCLEPALRDLALEGL